MDNIGKWKVLIGSRSFGKVFPEHIERLKDAGCVVYPNTVGRAYRAKELIKSLRDMDAIITGTDELTEEVIENAKRLKAIVKHGVGLETIDLVAAQRRGIAVSATPGVIENSVADLAMALILALARWVILANASVVSGSWKPFFGIELNGKTLGILGTGRIGKAVAIRARAFGMQVIAYDLFPDQEFSVAHGIQYVSFDELLLQSDFLSLHASAEMSEGPLIGEKEIEAMKNSAFLINTARGILVDENALAKALTTGGLAGAGIDTFTDEPPVDSPLLSLANVVLTPHLGGRTVDGQRKMGEMVIENCLRSLRGDDPLHQVSGSVDNLV